MAAKAKKDRRLLNQKEIETALQNNILANGRPNFAAAARELKIPRASLQFQAANLGLTSFNGIKTPTAEEHRVIVGLRDEVSKLRKQVTDSHRQALDDEALRDILGGLVAQDVKPPTWLQQVGRRKGTASEVPSTIWSDWHGGEVVSLRQTSGVNEFNVKIMDRRVERLVTSTIDLTRNHGPGNYPGMVMNWLGDFVSGMLHPELAKTDELNVLPTALHVRDLLVKCVEEMVEEYKRLYIPCTCGNHGRQTFKPEHKNYVFQNIDWLIYQMVARAIKDRKLDKYVTFDIPEDNEVHYAVYGRRYMAMHGDQMGVRGGDGIIGAIGPIMRGEMKVGRQASVVGRDYDVLLVGHWHQLLWLPRAIVNNALKGYDEFAKNSLRAAPSTPSQALWFDHPKWGRTAHREVFVEDPPQHKGAPWVGVFEKA